MIDSITSPSLAATSTTVQPAADAVATTPVSGDATATEKTKPATSVNISANGKAQAEKKQKTEIDNSDIDNSNLDEKVKEILKQIRKLQQELQEKVKALQEVMADQSLAPKTRDQQVSLLRGEMDSLQSAINDAKQAMNAALEASRASPEQRDLAHKLIQG